jgi:hypothetical protein
MRLGQMMFPYLIACFALAATGLLFSCGSQDQGPVPASEDVTEIIKQLELKAISAEFNLDTATIASVLHERFIAVYPHKLQNRQQELSGIYAGILKRKSDGETTDSLYLDDFRTHLYNDNKTAIATFYTVTSGKRNGVPYENQRWRWYDVWVNESEEWKLVSIQGTPVSSGN